MTSKFWLVVKTTLTHKDKKMCGFKTWLFGFDKIGPSLIQSALEVSSLFKNLFFTEEVVAEFL